MTIESLGYPGTIAPGVDWAKMQATLGDRYSVETPASFRVTTVPGGARQVKVGPGAASGWGVRDENDADIVVTLPTVSSGTKYFLIVLRRTWGITNTTTVEYIDCGTSFPTAMPAGRNVIPGDVDDQPLGVAALASGAGTLVGTITDIRGVGSDGDYQAGHILALSYLNYSGVKVRVNNIEYYRGHDASFNPVWIIGSGPTVVDTLAVVTGASAATMASGWSSANPMRLEVVRSGNLVEVDFAIQYRSGSALAASATGGNFPDTTMFTLSPTFRPAPEYLFFAVSYVGRASSTGSDASVGGFARVTSGGGVILTSGSVGANLYTRTDSVESVRGHFSFLQRG